VASSIQISTLKFNMPFLISPISRTCPTQQRILIDLMILSIWWRANCKFWISSLWNFLHPPVTSPLTGQSTLIRIDINKFNTYNLVFLVTASLPWEVEKTTGLFFEFQHLPCSRFPRHSRSPRMQTLAPTSAHCKWHSHSSRVSNGGPAVPWHQNPPLSYKRKGSLWSKAVTVSYTYCTWEMWGLTYATRFGVPCYRQ
jgi:hypothetical protein